jgi:hypothetical protein
MTLIIQKPTGAKLVFAKDFSFDPDAAAYIAAVEAADTQALETATRYAINNFVIGCKQDGIWSAIKASCILAGARTKEGAIIPLANASNSAPTLNGTAGGWNYDRKTGLRGNGTNNFIDCNRAPSAESSGNNAHFSYYVGQLGSGAISYMGATLSTGGTQAYSQIIDFSGLNTSINGTTGGIAIASISNTALGFVGTTRTGASSTALRAQRTSTAGSQAFTAANNLNFYVCCRNLNGAANSFTTTRFAFYSIGESLDLALLDARVTDLINAFAAAIP